MMAYRIVVLAVCVCYTDGAPKATGIEQFWTEDYKVFEKIYGKTSDKEIYGALLPATVNRGVFKTEASEKKERFQLGFDKDPYDDFNELLKKAKFKPEPAKSSFKFIKYDSFKPISEGNDPETYKYLQYLEGLDKEHDDIPTSNIFKPYMNYEKTNPKDTEAYKSIQDILDAHEKNREKKREDEFSGYVINKNKKPPRNRNNDLSHRCVPGRCKKRNNSIRSGTRPYVRRYKHRYTKH